MIVTYDLSKVAIRLIKKGIQGEFEMNLIKERPFAKVSFIH
jgi:hypothetical protein